VIVYAAIVGFGVVGDLWLSIYDHVPHVLLVGAFVGGLALWALREHVRHPVSTGIVGSTSYPVMARSGHTRLSWPRCPRQACAPKCPQSGRRG
jgi:hypothetical protein